MTVKNTLPFNILPLFVCIWEISGNSPHRRLLICVWVWRWVLTRLMVNSKSYEETAKGLWHVVRHAQLPVTRGSHRKAGAWRPPVVTRMIKRSFLFRSEGHCCRCTDRLQTPCPWKEVSVSRSKEDKTGRRMHEYFNINHFIKVCKLRFNFRWNYSHLLSKYAG